MKNSNFSKFILSSITNVRIVFIILFAIFGLIIAFVSFFVSSYYENKNMQNELLKSAEESFYLKESLLSDRIKLFENILFAVKRSTHFNEVLKDSEHIEGINDLFSTVMKTNDELMQLRYLNKNGHEVLRIDRKNIAGVAYYIEGEKLQNKADRYYFKESSKMAEGSIWASRIDLNEEDGRIVKPLVPTLRLSTPVYYDNEFRGIIIINIFIEKLLNELTSSAFFKVSLVDKDGYFIRHTHSTAKTIEDYSWSRYLNKRHTLKTVFPKLASKILKYKEFHDSNIFARNISDVFYNIDELRFVYIAKNEKVDQLKKKQSEYIIAVALVVFIISIPISFLLSYLPVRLSKELIEIQDKLEKENLIIDKYVPLAMTNLDGVITQVSDAFCKLTKYSREELIGESHKIISSSDTTEEIHQNLWNELKKFGKWSGELKNIDKGGEAYWVNININTMKDNENKAIGYHAYSENITHSKKLHAISITDGLTSLYNRRYFDEVFLQQIKLVKREKKILAFAMIDIDHFKQYNDTYGHQDGDKTLKKVAFTLNKSVNRPNDYAFRLGGEEFGILYTVLQENDALNIAEQIRTNIENLKIEHKGNSSSKYVTISIGLCLIKDSEIDDEEEIYKKTDAALYVAKQNGRNQVSVVEKN